MAGADLEIVKGYVSGMIGDITRLHTDYYYPNWNFGLDFEASIARELATFMLRYDDQQDAIWTLSQHHRVVATIIIDGAVEEKEGEARLRFFIVDDTLRGQGIGRRLMQTAIDFCDEKQFKRVNLKTLEGLHAACHLYDSFGFTVYKKTIEDGITELFYERYLPTR